MLFNRHTIIYLSKKDLSAFVTPLVKARYRLSYKLHQLHQKIIHFHPSHQNPAPKRSTHQIFALLTSKSSKLGSIFEKCSFFDFTPIIFDDLMLLMKFIY